MKSPQTLRRHFLLVFEPGPRICDAIKFSEPRCVIERDGSPLWSPLLLAGACPREKCNMRHQNDERYRLQGKEQKLNHVLCFQGAYTKMGHFMSTGLWPSRGYGRGGRVLAPSPGFRGRLPPTGGQAVGSHALGLSLMPLYNELFDGGLCSHDKSSSGTKNESRRILRFWSPTQMGLLWKTTSPTWQWLWWDLSHFPPLFSVLPTRVPEIPWGKQSKIEEKARAPTCGQACGTWQRPCQLDLLSVPKLT